MTYIPAIWLALVSIIIELGGVLCFLIQIRDKLTAPDTKPAAGEEK